MSHVSLKFEVGDGAQIKFWFDIWCGEEPLKDTFPELFRLARYKEAFFFFLISSIRRHLLWIIYNTVIAPLTVSWILFD